MAADESYLETFESDSSLLAKITKLQAFVRGDLVRKQMMEIRQLYEEIVHDIDGPEVEVEWSGGHVARPTIRKVKVPKIKSISEHLKDKTSISTKADSAGTMFRDMSGKASPVPQQSDVVESILERDLQMINSMQDSDQLFKRNSELVSIDIQTDLDTDKFLAVSSQQPCTTVCTEVQTDGTEFEVDNSAKYMQTLEQESNIASPRSRKCDTSDSHDDNSVEPSIHVSGENIPFTKTSVVQVKFGNAPNGCASNCDHNSPAEKSQSGSISIQSDEEDRAESQQEKPLPGDVSKTDEVITETKELPNDKDELLQLKNTMAMELLWVQQAIVSRKHYLRLKQQI